MSRVRACGEGARAGDASGATSAVADTQEQIERRRALIEMCGLGGFRGVTERLLPVFVHADRLADTDLTDRIKKNGRSSWS